MTLTETAVTQAGRASALLTARDLSVTFCPQPGAQGPGVAVLDRLSLDVHAGEFVAVLGPSGCGKSTLLRAMAGLLDSRARITGSLHVPRDRAGKRAAAWMPQRDGLLPWRRALSNALVGAIAAGVPRERARRRAHALFAEFGLSGFENAWPHELSGGMRQRLALLRTCLAERSVLLLDEPFGALDPMTRRRMNTWLASMRLAQREGAVLLVTHDVDEAMMLADRIVVLSERPGRVVHEVRAADFDRAGLLAALDS